MHRRLWPVAGGLVVLVATGCHEQHSPTEASTALPVAAVQSVSCDFPLLDQLVGDYFAGTDRTTAVALAMALQDAYAHGTPAATADAGFDLLAHLAAVVDAGPAASPSDGSEVANATLACMRIGFVQLVDFMGAFKEDGFFGVRGRDGSTTPAITRDGFAGVAPPSAGWASWLGGGTVVYGQRVNTFSSNEEIIFSAVDWSIIQAAPQPLNGEGVIGLCVANPDDRYRLQEHDIILPLADPLFLGCTSFASARSAPSTVASRVLRVVTDWIRPRPLYAAMAFGGTGGTAGGFSPFGVVEIGAVNPTFTLQPGDAVVGNVLAPIEFRTAGNGGTGVPGVTVSVRTILNNGKPLELLGTTTVVTGSDGVARFTDLVVTKPGVVILEATATTPGYPTVVYRSEPFHIKGPAGGKN